MSDRSPSPCHAVQLADRIDRLADLRVRAEAAFVIRRVGWRQSGLPLYGHAHRRYDNAIRRRGRLARRFTRATGELRAMGLDGPADRAEVVMRRALDFDVRALERRFGFGLPSPACAGRTA